MDRKIQVLESWKSKTAVIKEYKVTDNSLELEFEKVNFKFIFPKTKNDFMTVDSDYDISWLDNLNMKIIEKNYSEENIDKILTMINNQLVKLNKEYQKKRNNKIIIEEMKLIDENEIKFLKMKKKLGELIEKEMPKKISISSPGSTNSIDCQNTKFSNSNEKKIFDKETVIKIIGEEFLELYKKSLNTSKFKVSLNNDNIKSWKIILGNFSNTNLVDDLKQVKEKHGYDNIEFTINLNDELYPNYPPQIEFNKPKFRNSLTYKLSNLKMLHLDYWSPARTVEFIINKLHSILDKHCRIDLDNLSQKNNSTYSVLETALMQLCSHFDQQDDNLDDEKYEKINFSKSPSKSQTKYWKSGTGYGYNGAKDWDIDAYIESQKQKDRELSNILKTIYLGMLDDSEKNKETIKESFIMKYIISKLDGCTLLEITKKQESYDKILSILEVLLDKYQNEIISPEFMKLHSKIMEIYADIELAAKMGTQDDLSIRISVIKMKMDEVKSKNIDIIEKDKEIEKDNSSDKTIQQKYSEEMEKYKFMDTPIIHSGSKYYFQKNFDMGKHKKVTYHKRMVQELSILRKSILADYGASIYVAMDPDNISVLRVLITGPHDTPYDSGCFIFDVYIPEEFPNGPPLVYMQNTGNVRFNPNLYNCGKVCLSILGTWSGNKGETWNKETSSLLQVFMSIQSLILIEEPYFNEPGYESSMNTTRGREASSNYNNKIRLYTMRHAMKELIDSSEYPQFTEVLNNHFRLKREHILNVCKKWVDDAPIHAPTYDGFNKNDYKKVYEELESKLKKL